ncbi:MAG: hypothetical protein ACKVJK_06560 [Methylophagaceae bacterium]|jgi:hypothetical protein|tara:strand:+ start:3689 stop:4081 length:393 start_codon:yes stop_codon:yes gene_type:complete
MPQIKVITPPDLLHNSDPSILLIYPSSALKEEFQNTVQHWDLSFNLYIYSPQANDHNLDWLLSLVKMCDQTIIDLDHCDSQVRDLASYIIAQSNTLWLTNAVETVYNKLSINRIYDLQQLTEGVLSAKQQ